jgi:hypothetical protein
MTGLKTRHCSCGRQTSPQFAIQGEPAAQHPKGTMYRALTPAQNVDSEQIGTGGRKGERRSA